MKVRQIVTAAMADAHVPGLALAVIERGQVSWVGGFGVRSDDISDGVDAETVFAAASLSKPPFAYLVHRLAARDLLDLDAPLAELYPGPYDAYGLDPGDARLARVNARQVLCHTSGLGNWTPDDIGRVNFEPGTCWRYSGEGYLYLQRVIEHLAGAPLETLAERELFEPLGLTLSSYVWREAWSNVAEGHGTSSTGGHRFQTPFSPFSLHTTAREYGQLVATMMRDDHARDLFEPAVQVEGKLAWGLGFGLAGGLFWQWGDSGDFQSAVVGSLDEGHGLVCLTNSEHGLALCGGITAQLLGEKYAWPIHEVIKRGW